MLLSEQKSHFSCACVWSRSALTVWADFSILGPDRLALLPALPGVCLEGSAGPSATLSSWQPWKVGKCVNVFNYMLRPLSSPQHHPMSCNGTSSISVLHEKALDCLLEAPCRGHKGAHQFATARGSLQWTENSRVHVVFLYELMRRQCTLAWALVVHSDMTTGSWASLHGRGGAQTTSFQQLLSSAWWISLQPDWRASKLFGFFLLILFSTGTT